MAKLKPCPFCRGPAERSVTEINPFYFEAQAHCCYCGCEMRHKFSIPSDAKNPVGAAKRLISIMWNRRDGDGNV